jgi:hypothetical protein
VSLSPAESAAVTDDNEHPSPAGHYVVQVSPWEAGMSLWIETPMIVQRRGATTLLAFRDPRWSLDDATWLDDHRVRLTLRKYPGRRIPSQVCVEVDCSALTARVEAAAAVPLPELEAALDQAMRARPLQSISNLPG